ncbi:bifunctional adenosylcobinamide kinase/adenosylcobinamide-phosphate guanylyltransferase [Lachnoclostridium sp.]|uniref:bifunctional adenosylcobinamide kinase/adenosylcobinamide-phosphate guanylyltransferase n=1 Tax=Lachnoclostridium sp. TaxID=2028282 RepID=UPI00289A307D|nr:bifunctional adenosylcobinamide kinase/adenosylcobinamide-phosphate guanylyltransferase [Lachnoclostridium sp.]
MRYLITGGSGSGKSAYAEEIASSLGLPVYYLATMQAYGGEGKKRVKRHRLLRSGRNFHTIEKSLTVNEVTVPKESVVLLECLSNLLANEMFDPKGIGTDGLVNGVLRQVELLSEKTTHLIVVSNDIGFDGNSYDEGTSLYIKALGELHTRLAEGFEHVVEVVCGISLNHKGPRSVNEVMSK